MLTDSIYGYTTGSSAAAACKIAVLTLFRGTKVESVDIDTPKGWLITILANYTLVTEDKVSCYVIKDYSDDPDVTRGIKIHVTAVKTSEPGIVIKTAEGIGIVTKRGLRVPVGEPAINPVPKQMILSEINKVLPTECGVEVTISAPKGEEIAKKTFNSKLGIIGGISILGTTGIVTPMSEDAYKESLLLELSVKYNAGGGDLIIFIFGNFGSDYLKEHNIPEDLVQKTSNFIKYMVTGAKDLGYKRILLVGHAGKMVKVAHNMENTHSKYGDNRMVSINQSCQNIGLVNNTLILESNTTDEAIEHLKSADIDKKVFTDISKRISNVCEEWTSNQLKVENIIFTTEFGYISSSEQGDSWLKELSR